MWKFFSRYGLFLILSVGMHALILSALLLGFASTPELPKPLGASKKKNVIQAVSVDASQVQEELRKLESADKQRKQQELERQKRLQDQARKVEQQRIREQEKLADLKKQQQQEQQRLHEQKQEQERKIRELKQKQEQEQQRVEKLKIAAAELAKQKEVEKKRLQKLQQEKEVAEKKRLQKLKEEKAALEKKRLQKLKEEKEALEKKRREKQLREAQARREKALKEQLVAEERAEQERELQGVRSRYIDSIAAVVRGNWRRPAQVDKDASCLVVVTQIPGGEIISYRVSSCTGGKNFQRSVETAVGKTSHLPAPPDPRVFDRVIRFTFTGK